MRIAHIISTFPPHLGGMGQVAYEEAIRLTKMGHEVKVFTMQYGNEEPDDEQVSIERLCPWVKYGDAGLVPQLVRRLKAYEIVHVHYPWYGGIEWVLLASLLYKNKVVVTYHMDAAPVGIVKRAVQRVYDVLFAGPLFKAAKDVFIVDREYKEASTFGSVLNPAKTHVLSNAVDTSVFFPNYQVVLPEGLTGWEGKSIFLFVGNPMPLKRLDVIIQALARVPDKSVVLAVVGAGYALQEYVHLVKKLGLEERVRFIGAIADRGVLNRYYNAAKALVVAAVHESFSLVAIEAMSAGCPVIASNVPGIRARVSHETDGLLFDPFDGDGLVQALKRVAKMSLEERGRMGMNGRKKVEELYSWDKHIQDLVHYYKSL